MIIRVEIEMDQGANVVRVERELPDPEEVVVQVASGDRVVHSYRTDPSDTARHLASLAVEALG